MDLGVLMWHPHKHRMGGTSWAWAGRSRDSEMPIQMAGARDHLLDLVGSPGQSPMALTLISKEMTETGPQL